MKKKLKQSIPYLVVYITIPGTNVSWLLDTRRDAINKRSPRIFPCAMASRDKVFQEIHDRELQ